MSSLWESKPVEDRRVSIWVYDKHFNIFFNDWEI